MSKKIVIVGGVAGGMSCAARIKRLDDSAEVVVFEKGPDVSFANCGMPYYIGGVIRNREDMLVQTPDTLKARYDLDIRVRHEVTRIDRENRTVEARDLTTGRTVSESYDALVLAPGADPVRPPIPGIDRPHVFVLRDLTDMDRIAERAASARSACVVGGGFIGLELVENLRERGLDVTLVEKMDQVLTPLDREMTQPLIQEMLLHGVQVVLGAQAERIEDGRVHLSNGQDIAADLVCVGVGVCPSSRLASEAGLDVGPRGHIRVDDRMRTSDAHIFAVGDAVEVRNFVTGKADAIPLAGPANRQGRVAADNICGRESTIPPVQGTAIVKVFGLAAANTGLNERALKAEGREFLKAYIHPTQLPRYYPGATNVSVKLLFDRQGTLLGAQAVGMAGVEVMIDVLATALRAGMTVEDLEHLELAYSPQWGGAKHGVNMLGFTASNMLKGDVDMVNIEDAPDDMVWLDVRQPEETEAGVIPEAKVIALSELRRRHEELPRDREIGVYCAVGLRGYLACRYLAQQGYKVRNLNGGYCSYRWSEMMKGRYETVAAGSCGARREDADRLGAGRDAASCCNGEFAADPKTGAAASADAVVQVDACGLQCPGPIMKVKQTMDAMAPGQVLEILSSDPGFTADIPAWCRRTGNTLLEVRPQGGNYLARIQKADGAVQSGPRPGAAPAGGSDHRGKTLICFSNDLDKVLATFIIANGAAAMGNPVTLFFTFWASTFCAATTPSPSARGCWTACSA